MRKRITCVTTKLDGDSIGIILPDEITREFNIIENQELRMKVERKLIAGDKSIIVLNITC